MLTQEENERLTQVGRGTPMGELMRRYWHPIAGSVELDDEPTKPVRILGENLVLYKDRGGRLGLLGRQCSHRKTSLEYGIPEAEGLRCPYHGWLYDAEGHCLEQPAEPPVSGSGMPDPYQPGSVGAGHALPFRDKIQHTAYSVQELGGLVWAYLGPAPAPLLPRYDVFAWEDALRDIGYAELHCNWLQCSENFVDLTHVDYLHGLYYRYVLEKEGKPPRPAETRAYGGARHVRLGFDVFEHGIIKRRIVEGGSEDSETWRVGTSPLVFPYMIKIGSSCMQIPVPVDDDHTMFLMYTCYRPPSGTAAPRQDRVPIYQVPLSGSTGKFVTDWVTAQDIMAMVTQGPVLDRAGEKLGASDQGLIFYRKVLEQQIERVEDGGDPLGVIRDPAQNECIQFAQAGGGSVYHFMENH